MKKPWIGVTRKIANEAIEWLTNKAADYDNLDLEMLPRESDHAVLPTLLTAETRLLMGARAFSLMKPTAVFVNASRGGNADENASAANIYVPSRKEPLTPLC